jgi:N-acetyl-1-D-myo-inositol-2-amino-2-deoxy-alpha-D-glucopyranoside deacetylase
MNMAKTLIMVGAHPDDETFGMGGTLAYYAANGVKVYYVCATRGEVGVADSEYLSGYSSPGDMRWAELSCAARILGLADIIHLGYRDSGMPGSDDNKHPQALMAAPVAEVAGRIVKVIRELKPQVIVTFDPIGGYKHPDHVAIHNATVKAFFAAAEPGQYPEAGPVFQPRKLYFSIFPRGMLKIIVRLMPLIGKDPHKLGRNRDIDLTSFANVDYPVHASIRLTRQANEAQKKASECHASQLAGGPAGGWLFRIAEKIIGRRDLFMRYYPPVEGRIREHDLFQGL